jgi:cellulose synthase/poly-beta-1,6-N-acetylglucosamine synthase-like glycosyltransferase
LEGDFVAFFDNDMKPKEEFLLRTVPWFYSYSEQKKRYNFLQKIHIFKKDIIKTKELRLSKLHSFLR